MITKDIQVRVRYGETDQMGFLYHAHYVAYYDVARTEMLRSIGLSNVELEANGYMLPVLEVNVNYKNPAHYDDLLTVRVSLLEMPRVKMTFHYEIFRPDGDLINKATVTLAFMDSSTKRACRPPASFLDVLRPYFDR